MTRQGPFDYVIVGGGSAGVALIEVGDRRAGYSGFQRSRRSNHSR
jgi:hypothetical protein